MEERHQRFQSKLSKRLSGNTSDLEKPMLTERKRTDITGVVEKPVTRKSEGIGVLEKALNRKRQAISELYGEPSRKQKKTDTKSHTTSKTETKQSPTASKTDAKQSVTTKKPETNESRTNFDVPDSWKPHVKIRRLPGKLVKLLQKSPEPVQQDQPSKPAVLLKHGQQIKGVKDVQQAQPSLPQASVLRTPHAKPTVSKPLIPTTDTAMHEQLVKTPKPSVQSISDETIKNSKLDTELTFEEYFKLLDAVKTRAVPKITTSFLSCEGIPKLFLAELFKQCEDTYKEWDNVHKRVLPEDADLPPTLAEYVKRARKKQPYQNWDELVQYVLQMPHFLLNLCLGAMLKDRDKCSPYRTKDLLMRLGLIGYLLYGGMLHTNPQFKQQTQATDVKNIHLQTTSTSAQADTMDYATDDEEMHDDYIDEEVHLIDENTPIEIKEEPEATYEVSSSHSKSLQLPSALKSSMSSPLKERTISPGSSLLKPQRQVSSSSGSVSRTPAASVPPNTRGIKEEPCTKNTDHEGNCRQQMSVSVARYGTGSENEQVSRQATSQTVLEEKDGKVSFKTIRFSQPVYHKLNIGPPPFHKHYSEGRIHQEYSAQPHTDVEREHDEQFIYETKCPLCTYTAKADSEKLLRSAYGEHILHTHCDPQTCKPYEETLFIVLAKKLYVENKNPEGRIFICPQCFKVDVSRQCHYFHVRSHAHQVQHLGCLVCCTWFDNYKELFDHYVHCHHVGRSELPDPDDMEPFSYEAPVPGTDNHKREVAQAPMSTAYIQLYIQMEKRHRGLLPSLLQASAARKKIKDKTSTSSLLTQYFPVTNRTFTLYKYASPKGKTESVATNLDAGNSPALQVKTEPLEDPAQDTTDGPNCEVHTMACPFCKFTLRSQNGESKLAVTWTQHIYMAHCEPKTKKVYEETLQIIRARLLWLDNPFMPDKNQIFTCPVCLRLETNREAYYNHVLSHPGQEQHLMCFLCVTGYNSYTELFDHCKQTHNIHIHFKNTLPCSKPWPKQQKIHAKCSNRPAVALSTPLYRRIYAEMEEKHPDILKPQKSGVRTLEGESAVVGHNWTDKKESSGEMYCRFCGNTFPDAASREIHEILTHFMDLAVDDDTRDLKDKLEICVITSKETTVQKLKSQASLKEIGHNVAQYFLYTCHYCSLNFSNTTARYKHESQTHQLSISKKEEETRNMPESEMYKCNFCLLLFCDQVDMKDHKMKEHKSEVIDEILQTYSRLKAEDWASLGYAHLLKKCKLCDYRTTNRIKLNVHKKEHHAIKEYNMCTTCGLLFLSPVLQASHQKACNNCAAPGQEVSCYKCGLILATAHLLSIHQKFINCTDDKEFKAANIMEYPRTTGNPVHVVDSEEGIYNPETWIFYCRYCGEQCKDELMRDAHEHNEHYEEQTKERLRSEHLGAEQWINLGYEHLLLKCSLCDFKATDSDGIDKHNRLMHEKLTCKNSCGKTFLNENAQKRHEYTCDWEQIRCERCNFVCINYDILNEHRRSVNCTNDPNFVPYVPQPDPYLCHKCGSVFGSRSVLYKHKKTNCNKDPDFVKPHPHKPASKSPCERCGKMLTAYSMRFHLAMVNCNGDPDFKPSKEVRESFYRHVCDKCGKRYIKRISLYNHNASVNCNNSDDFKPKPIIKQKHGKPKKPSERVQCPKCFRTIVKDSLKNHLANVNCTNDPNFVPRGGPAMCEKCGKVFNTKASLLSHNMITNCTGDPNFERKWKKPKIVENPEREQSDTDSQHGDTEQDSDSTVANEAAKFLEQELARLESNKTQIHSMHEEDIEDKESEAEETTLTYDPPCAKIPQPIDLRKCQFVGSSKSSIALKPTKSSTSSITATKIISVQPARLAAQHDSTVTDRASSLDKPVATNVSSVLPPPSEIISTAQGSTTVKALPRSILTKSSPHVVGAGLQAKPPSLLVRGSDLPAVSTTQTVGKSVVVPPYGKKLSYSSSNKVQSSQIEGERKDMRAVSQQQLISSQASVATKQFTPTSSVSKQQQVTAPNTALPYHVSARITEVEQAHASTSSLVPPPQQSAPKPAVVAQAPPSTVKSTPVSLSETDTVISAIEGGQVDDCIELTQAAGQEMDNEQFQRLLTTVLVGRGLTRDDASGDVIVYLDQS